MIVIDVRYCKGCGICVRFCPKHILQLGDEVSSRGYFVPYVTDQDECNHCHQCELLCPDFAIFAVEEEESGSR